MPSREDWVLAEMVVQLQKLVEAASTSRSVTASMLPMSSRVHAVLDKKKRAVNSP